MIMWDYVGQPPPAVHSSEARSPLLPGNLFTRQYLAQSDPASTLAPPARILHSPLSSAELSSPPPPASAPDTADHETTGPTPVFSYPQLTTRRNITTPDSKRSFRFCASDPNKVCHSQQPHREESPPCHSEQPYREESPHPVIPSSPIARNSPLVIPSSPIARNPPPLSFRAAPSRGICFCLLCCQ